MAKNTIQRMSVAQYAAATAQTRQNVLYHISKGNDLDAVTSSEKIGKTYVLNINTTTLQKFIKNNLK